MNNELDVFELGEVNPPTYAREKREVDGSLVLVKPGKKIKTTNTDIEVFTSTKDIVKIGDLTFEKEEIFPWISILKDNILIEEVDTDETVSIIDLEELKIFSINWYFNNVEVVSDIN